MDSYTNTSLYGAIFKRKSFHLFRGVGEDRLVQSELDALVRRDGIRHNDSNPQSDGWHQIQEGYVQGKAQTARGDLVR